MQWFKANFAVYDFPVGAGLVYPGAQWTLQNDVMYKENRCYDGEPSNSKSPLRW
jgi:hypothetical protein